MQQLISLILTVFISFSMNSAVVGITSQTPQEVATETMKAFETQKSEVLEAYDGNAYVSFLNNVQGDEEAVKAIYEAMFEDFSYEIVETKQKNNVAVAKVIIKTDDFSKVNDAYTKAAQAYIMENAGTDKVADKEALGAKCMELYVAEMQRAAEGEPSLESTQFVAMVENGYYGWNVIISDELMKAVLGNLELPEMPTENKK